MKYIVVLQLPFNGKKFNVGFKRTGFRAPYAMRGPVDVEALAEKDKAQIERWTKSNADKRADLEEDFVLSPVVGPFIASAYEDGKVTETKGTRIFDILSDADYAEASLPPKAELHVQLQEKEGALSAAQEKIKALEAQLAKGKTTKPE